jgi:hypothetical protein
MISLLSLKGLIGCPRCRRSVCDGRSNRNFTQRFTMCGRQGTGPYGMFIAVDGAGGKRGGNYRFRLVRIAYS